MLLELDWTHFDPSEGSNERAERRHRAARLSTGDRRERLLLFVAGTVIDDEADGPVPLTHLLRRVGNHHDVVTRHVGTAVLALLNVEGDRHRATALRRQRGEIRGDTRTEKVAATRLEVL